MALKYYIDYTNISNDEIRVEIHQDSFIGTALAIQGKATLKQASVDSVLSPLRGMGLSLDLEASKDLDFTDLYSEKETEFKVFLYRNSVRLFAGFIKPDGLWQDFVRDNWIISLECIDGLGVLKNLRFVNPDGDSFVGYMTEEDIIYYCLNRTTLDLPINVKIGLSAVGQAETNKAITSKIRLNTERFYKDSEEDEDKEIMDCEEILKSILEKYNAVIQQHEGEWCIFRPLDVFIPNTTLGSQGFNEFYRYDRNAVGLITANGSVKKISKRTHYQLGSNINGFFPHHASENQRIEIKGAVSAFRVKFAYGLVASLLGNPKFLNNASGWDRGAGARSTFLPSGGIEWKPPINRLGWNSLSAYEYRRSSNLQVKKDDSLMLEVNGITSGFLRGFRFSMRLISSVGTYYLHNNEWLAGNLIGITTEVGTYKDVTINCYDDNNNNYGAYLKLGTGVDENIRLQIADIPEDGLIQLTIYRPSLEVTPEEFIINESNNDLSGVNFTCGNIGAETYAKLYSFDLKPNEGDREREGERHTAYATPAKSSDIEEPKEVFNGDLESDIYVGAMKLSDGTNTTYWYRDGYFEREELLRIMVEDRIRLQNKVQKVFSGGVFGYLPSLAVIQINNLQGKFLPTAYSWDSKQDLCNFTMQEFYNDNLTSSEDPGADLLYDKSYDRGRVIKPTIAG